MFKNYNLIKIIFIGTIFRLIFFIFLNGVSWDSPRYLEQASNLFLGILGQSQSEFGLLGRFILPPAYPLFISGLSLFVKSMLLSGKLISLVSSIAVIFLTYLLGKVLFNEKVGKYAAFFTAVYPQFWQDAGEVVIEPFVSLVLLVSLLTFWYAVKKGRWYFLWSGLLSGLAVLIKPVFLPVFLLLAISCFLLRKIRIPQLLYFLGIIVFIYGIYSFWMIKQTGSDLYNYPKSVLTETLYIEGGFPDAFALNSSGTTLKFMSNNYNHLDFLKTRPLTYSFLAVQSFIEGVTYLFWGNIMLGFCFYFVLRRFITPEYISGLKSNLYRESYIFIPVISSIIFYSLLLTHKNFMGRMDSTILPLYFMLVGEGIIIVKKEFKSFSARNNKLILRKLITIPVIFAFLATALTIFYPMARNIVIYENGKIMLRDKFIKQSVRKIEKYKTGTVMTSLADGRAIAYLANRRIIYYPANNDINSIYHYAEENNACCIIVEDEKIKNSDKIILQDIWQPFMGSHYRLFVYTLL